MTADEAQDQATREVTELWEVADVSLKLLALRNYAIAQRTRVLTQEAELADAIAQRDAAREPRIVSDEELLALIWKHFPAVNGIQPHVYVRWKDGIDVDYPIHAMRNFADELSRVQKGE